MDSYIVGFDKRDGLERDVLVGVLLKALPSELLCVSLEFLQHTALINIVADFVLFDDLLPNLDPLLPIAIVF